MKPEIRNLEPHKVLFVRKLGDYNRSGKLAWTELMAFAGARNLIKPDTKMIGICHDDPTTTPKEKLRYDACITIDKDIEVAGAAGIQTIAGGNYAVFLHKGPFEKLVNTYNHIFDEWLPSSGATLRTVPIFEQYLNLAHENPEELLTEIYIPID